jgi:1-pyrroline-5-carboxylate dehydrogenase
MAARSKTPKKPVRKPATRKAAAPAPFRLTYGTMFNPPEELHTRFEKALIKLKGELGMDHPMFINGQARYIADKFEDHSPINTNWVLGVFQRARIEDMHDAVAAAEAAFPTWSGLPWKQRVRYMRKVAAQIEKRVYEIAAAVALEVGKNRMEALGEIQESADIISYACDRMEASNGYVLELGRDPVVGYQSDNVSVLKPYGVWAVIAPFNFPFALAAGPVGNALLTGNTVVFKPAEDTSWAGTLLAECIRDAGLPNGAFNLVTGRGSVVGKALVEDPRLAGITFTGSYDVGMGILRTMAAGKYPRPAVLEMGGKNPAIVSRKANLEDAATGIVRSAFGLQGQKCSATSRILVEAPVKDKLLDLIVAKTEKLVLGDPTERPVYLGPVVNANGYRSFGEFTEELSQAGKIVTGGKQRTDGDYANGYFCEATVVDEVPLDHRLWKYEMFLPITLIAPVATLAEAMTIANDVDYGLTAGFYGSPSEAEWFFNNIQAGVTYANRPQGATTGAWPGLQPFGGWKGSGSSGKGAWGPYYSLAYMHEQSQTRVRKVK